MASLTWPDFSPILSVEVPAMAALVASSARRLLADVEIGNEPDCRDVLLDDVGDAFLESRDEPKKTPPRREVSGGRKPPWEERLDPAEATKNHN